MTIRDNSKAIGDLAELMVATKYVELGCFVSRPLTDNAPYDLIIDDGTFLKKVQVKARSPKDGKINVELFTSMVNYNRSYENGDFDLLAIYNIDTKQIAVISWEEASRNGTTVVFRITPPLNNQTKNVRLFENYVI